MQEVIVKGYVSESQINFPDKDTWEWPAGWLPNRGDYLDCRGKNIRIAGVVMNIHFTIQGSGDDDPMGQVSILVNDE